MTVFKTHCDHKFGFGGNVGFGVLTQMGGRFVECVDAKNAVIDQQIQVAA